MILPLTSLGINSCIQGTKAASDNDLHNENIIIEKNNRKKNNQN